MVFHELEDIILPNEKFTFLVGAGISIEPPSRLKSAVEIVKILLNLCVRGNEKTVPSCVENHCTFLWED